MKASLMTIVALVSLELLVSMTCIIDMFTYKIVLFDAANELE